MKCPSCTATTLAITERQGIEIDYCPDCRGVWLDRGELDKLIERAAAADAPPARAATARDDRPETRRDDRRPDRDDDDDDDDRYRGGYARKSKKKSLLGEIFDFG